jgi:hypothetical protein
LAPHSGIFFLSHGFFSHRKLAPRHTFLESELLSPAYRWHYFKPQTIVNIFLQQANGLSLWLFLQKQHIFIHLIAVIVM